MMGKFSDGQRQRQRQRRKTIGLILSKIQSLCNVRFKFWYISLPSSTKQQRELTKFRVLWGT